MKDLGLVSIIMPAYNSGAYIEEAIQSVINQEYIQWELWVIDDASKDNTVLKVHEFLKQDPRIRLLQNDRNQGTAISRNRGIKAASGKFIAFLDADDLWFPKKLWAQLQFMEKHGQNMCFSSYRLMDEKGELQPKIIEALPVLSYKKLMKANYVGNLTGIYNAKKLGKIYAPLILKRQDWGLWLEIFKKCGEIKPIMEPLAAYRLHHESMSKNKTGLLKYNFSVYKKVLGFGTLKSLGWMLIFLNEHFFVKNKQVKNLD